jgi:ribonucleoside-diphosphate reductase beta chain
MSVFKTNKVNHTEQPAFFGEPVNIARYESVKYPQFEKLTEKQLSFFWRPEEIELGRDSKDFKSINSHEQHIFTSNLKRQILLDSVQGRAPSLAFLPICSLPELETWIQTWTFSETIHSRSYTHIIRNIYSDPSKVFDDMLDIQEIVDCASDISKYYDMLIDINYLSRITPILRDAYSGYSEYEHKKALWLCLNAVNALEGVRFYVSFACSWAFAEVKKMEGNAKIIKLIARDENVHLAATQQLLKILPQEDPDFVKIANDTREECFNMFKSVIDQEKAWAKYLFKDGSMIGLNEQLLCDYIDWIANKRMVSIGINKTIKTGANPLPWTQKWISGSEVQVAPQETEITSYLSGGINKDVNENTFSGFKL